MSYFIYTDLISSLLDPKLVDPRSTLIYVVAYGLRYFVFPKLYISFFQKHFLTKIKSRIATKLRCLLKWNYYSRLTIWLINVKWLEFYMR